MAAFSFPDTWQSVQPTLRDAAANLAAAASEFSMTLTAHLLAFALCLAASLTKTILLFAWNGQSASRGSHRHP